MKRVLRHFEPWLVFSHAVKMHTIKRAKCMRKITCEVYLSTDSLEIDFPVILWRKFIHSQLLELFQLLHSKTFSILPVPEEFQYELLGQLLVDCDAAWCMSCSLREFSHA